MASFGQRTNRIRPFSFFIFGDVIKRSKVNAVNVVKFSHDMPFFANLANFLPLQLTPTKFGGSAKLAKMASFGQRTNRIRLFSFFVICGFQKLVSLIKFRRDGKKIGKIWYNWHNSASVFAD